MNKSDLNDLIRKLPRWAKVAFAARCARRVQPLYAKWKKATPEHIHAVEVAIQLAENMATYAAHDAAHDAARDAARDAAHAAHAARAARDTARAAAFAAEAAACAACAAYAAYAYAAADAAFAAEAAAYVDTYAILQADCELLFKLSRENGWDDNTPVPPTVFGPLWPEGNTPSDDEKSGKFAIDKPQERLQVDLTIPNDLDADEVSGAVLKLYQAMNAHHIALGGTGLKLEEFLRMVGANVEVEV